MNCRTFGQKATIEMFVKLPSGRVKAGPVQRVLISDRGVVYCAWPYLIVV
jgi:hypothetical protein